MVYDDDDDGDDDDDDDDYYLSTIQSSPAWCINLKISFKQS